jgi:endoglucanase
VASEQSLLDARLNPGSAFADLVERSTGEEVVEAWGGHFDAGDWDRRVEHLWFVRSVAQLVRGHPDIFAELELNIPESGNGIPDLLDEGLWSLDLYRRMQTDDGGVRGGIEASEHPPVNATSWTDDLAVFAFEPDPWSTFLYASVAAEVSLTLRPYDPELAEQYLASALAAYAWADGRLRELADEAQPGNDDAVALVRSQKNVAAAALLLTTGDAGWHDDFVDTAEFLTGDDRMMSCHRHTQCDAGWLYLEADESVTDPAIRAEVADRFVDSADAIVNAASSTKYGWTTENPFVPLIWGLGAGGTPHSSGLLKAYQLTGDEQYRNAVLQSASFTLGLNPTNRVYLTGIGRQPVRHPLIVDTLHGGVPVWPGTPVYGPHQLEEGGPSQWGLDGVLRPGGAHPDPVSVPYLWQWYDVSNLAFFTEYTMHQSHSEALLAFATLAATS